MKPLTKEEAVKQGRYLFSYYNGEYSYRKDGFEHLIRNGREIAKGDFVFSYTNGDYEYSKNLVTHKFNKNGKEITNKMTERQAGRNEMREALSSAINGQLTQKQVNILLSR